MGVAEVGKFCKLDEAGDSLGRAAMSRLNLPAFWSCSCLHICKDYARFKSKTESILLLYTSIFFDLRGWLTGLGGKDATVIYLQSKTGPITAL
jgi:hypothetical protein